MTLAGEARTNNLDKAMDFFSPFERRGEPLAPRWLFARRLAINIGLALSLILISLVGGMAGYHYIEGSGWLDAFDQAAMIIGGMGPYSEPKTDGGKLFAGFYALYSGLLLIGLAGLILAPVFHRVMHHFHLPDDEAMTGGASKRVKNQSRRKA